MKAKAPRVKLKPFSNKEINEDDEATLNFHRPNQTLAVSLRLLLRQPLASRDYSLGSHDSMNREQARPRRSNHDLRGSGATQKTGLKNLLCHTRRFFWAPLPPPKALGASVFGFASAWALTRLEFWMHSYIIASCYTHYANTDEKNQTYSNRSHEQCCDVGVFIPLTPSFVEASAFSAGCGVGRWLGLAGLLYSDGTW